jgi:uracil-DNA glycosylase
MPEPTYPTLEVLLAAVKGCRACEVHLPLGPRPVLRAAASARILIVGQAPGLRVHTTGLRWDDLSGVRLRGWMGLTKDTFYDESTGGIAVESTRDTPATNRDRPWQHRRQGPDSPLTRGFSSHDHEI